MQHLRKATEYLFLPWFQQNLSACAKQQPRFSNEATHFISDGNLVPEKLDLVSEQKTRFSAKFNSWLGFGTKF